MVINYGKSMAYWLSERRMAEKMISKIYEFADIVVKAIYKDTYLEDMCKAYESTKEPELTIEVNEEDVEREADKSEIKGFSYGYLESLAFYRKFCEAVVYQDVLLFHGSVVMVDGDAYVFTAPSGTGKSTHTGLWREVFGERAVMINDDKPLFRFEQAGILAYGTPWDGKHHLSTKTKAKIKGICILERGEKNQIQREDFYQAYPFILNQTYRPDDEDGMRKTLELVNQMMTGIPIYRMACNISKEAAVMAYECMSERSKEK